MSNALSPILFFLLLISNQSVSHAQNILDGEPVQSKLVIVKHYSQEIWIVKAGETFAELVLVLEPYDELERARLTEYLLQTNPRAFINGDANYIRAGARLQLPVLPKHARKSRLIPDSTP